jgi:alcohol dehydrogenase
MRQDCDKLLVVLQQWIERTQITKLGHYGISPSDFAKILDKTNNKNSPVVLSREQMQSILKARF